VTGWTKSSLCDHPLSPYYLAGHEDWEEGRQARFVRGAVVYEL